MPNGVRVVNELIIEPNKSLVANTETGIDNFPNWSLISYNGAIKYKYNGELKNFLPENLFTQYSIGSSLLQNYSISNEKIVDKTITGNKIANESILEINLAKNIISTSLLKDRSVTGAKISLGTIEYENLSGALKEILDIDERSITKNLLSQDVQDILSNCVVQNKVNNITNIYTTTSISGNLNVTGNVNAAKTYNPVYADLAEGYKIDEYIEPGNIVTLNSEEKLRKAVSGDLIIGVVSDNFAICFDANEEEIKNKTKSPVGLIGKVKVFVKGYIKKGDYINISDEIPGVAVGSKEKTKYSLGKALADKTNKDIEKVLCLIFPN